MGFSSIFIAIVSACRSVSLTDTVTSASRGPPGNPPTLCYICFGSLLILIPNCYHALVTHNSRATSPNISADRSSTSPLPSSPCFSFFARRCSPRTLIRSSRCPDSTSIWLTYFPPVVWLGRICPCSSAHAHSCVGPSSAACTLPSIFRIDLIESYCVARSRKGGDQLRAIMNQSVRRGLLCMGLVGICCSLSTARVISLERDYI